MSWIFKLSSESKRQKFTKKNFSELKLSLNFQPKIRYSQKLMLCNSWQAEKHTNSAKRKLSFGFWKEIFPILPIFGLTLSEYFEKNDFFDWWKIKRKRKFSKCELSMTSENSEFSQQFQNIGFRNGNCRKCGTFWIFKMRKCRLFWVFVVG